MSKPKEGTYKCGNNFSFKHYEDKKCRPRSDEFRILEILNFHPCVCKMGSSTLCSYEMSATDINIELNQNSLYQIPHAVIID